MSEKQKRINGMTSGRSVDKFAKAGLTPLHGQHADAPIVDEFPFCLECRLIHTFKIGSHLEECTTTSQPRRSKRST